MALLEAIHRILVVGHGPKYDKVARRLLGLSSFYEGLDSKSGSLINKFLHFGSTNLGQGTIGACSQATRAH